MELSINSGKSYNGIIEVYRYALTFIVAIMHFNPEGALSGGYVAVDFFFILSGFYLMETLKRSPQSALRFCLRKYFQVFWIFVISILLFDLYAFRDGIGNGVRKIVLSVPDMLGLQMTGVFYPTANGVVWYISAMLIASFFIVAIYNLSRESSLNLWFPLFIVIGYAWISYYANNLDVTIRMKGERLIPPGLIRGVSGMCIGVLLNLLCKTPFFSHFKKCSMRLLISFVELIVLSISLSLLFLYPHSKMDFLQLICFPVLIIIANLKKTYWSGFIDRMGLILIKCIGKEYTLALYCNSIVVSSIMNSVFHLSKTAWYSSVVYLISWLVFSYIMMVICRWLNKVTITQTAQRYL